MKKQILVLASPSHPDLHVLDTLREQADLEVVGDLEEAREAVAQAEILFALESKCTWMLKEIWPDAGALRWVQSSYAGVETLLFPEFSESDVILTNARGLYSNVLAEFVVGAILYVAKRLDELHSNQRAGVWARLEVEEVRGGTVGIVGVGDVGRTCGLQLRPLGMRLLGCRRKATKTEVPPFEEIYPPRRLPEMLARCDWVVVATPLTAETRGLIGEAELKAMKPEGVLINIGRGAVVQQAALVRALREGWIRRAILDVVEPEPLPKDNELWHTPNVLLTAHSADHTSDDLVQASRLFVDNFHRYLKGEPLRGRVDKKAGY